MNAHHGSKQDELARKARQAFLKEERVRESERRIADEKKRQAATSAKTAKLRGLREARDAAEREAAPTATTSKPEASAKTRVLRPGVRLRKNPA
jgi:hypothetical protein